MLEQPILKADLLGSLPDEWPQDPFSEIQRHVRSMGRKVAVLDDDPTGTQTVHDLWVVTRWTADTLRPVLEDENPLFFVLTNSRSLPEGRAVALNREIAANLAALAREAGCQVDVVSRSDSTLRGHFPAEIDALRETLEGRLPCTYDGVILCPFFLEGGRLTAGDIHWVTEGDSLIPAAQTEYARDVTFGYQHSNLRQWVEEKTGGRLPASEVVSISLQNIRQGGPEGVRQVLRQVTGGRAGVVNAVNYRDLAVFVAGLLAAEDDGQRFLFRTAASFVKVRGGIPDRGLLAARDMAPPGQAGTGGGLIVVGSYVQKTTRQLEQAMRLPGVQAVELSVRRVLDVTRPKETARDTARGIARDIAREIDRVVKEANDALAAGQDALIYTSRDLVTDRGRAGELDIGQRVSSALVEIVRRVNPMPRIGRMPRYLIAKGGITSSDVATEGLGVQRAWVLGQILPGIPVWRLGAESRFPGLPYVVFPGNVGTDDSLAEAIQILRGES